MPTICNPGRTPYRCSVQLLASAVLIGQGTGVGKTAITGLSNSCVPVIDAGTLDTGVCVCIISA